MRTSIAINHIWDAEDGNLEQLSLVTLCVLSIGLLETDRYTFLRSAISLE